MKYITDSSILKKDDIFLGNNVNKYFNKFLYTCEIISNITGTLVLIVGVIKGLIMLKGYFYKLEDEREVIQARLEIAESVLLGLTFMLAADVIKTIRVPSFLQLIRVTILIAIREFLTYHLDKEYKDLKVLKKNLKAKS